jgi:hypothetical protein
MAEQGKRVKLKSPYTDHIFDPWGGKKSPKPTDVNKGNKGKK